MAATSDLSAPAATFVSIEEYLRTSYRPDVEYIDGVPQGEARSVFGAWQAAVFAKWAV